VTAVPHEFYATQLTPNEFMVAVTLLHLSNSKGVVDATVEELTLLTRFSPETMRRAFRKLEEVGILSTTRTKRNLGKYSKNRYQLLVSAPVPEAVDPLKRESSWTSTTPPARGVTDQSSLQSEGWKPPLQPEGTTGSYVASKATKSELQALGTSYLKGHAESVPSERWEESMNKWNADDDFVGAVGLFEEDVAPSGKPKPKADRRKSGTRKQRPESEWTANDVAAEFAYQLGRRFPRIPGLVNQAAVRGALMRYRSQFDTTAEVEMEIMRMYFEDEYNLKLAQESPTRAHGKYLAMFKTHIPQAHERLGLDFGESRVVIDQEDVAEYIYSTDGTEFENNMSGRAALKGYEQRLLQNS
jgi:hypothetical protein